MFPAEIQRDVHIRINTTLDSIFENNETIEVVALLPEDQGSCRAQVIIVDNGKYVCMYVHMLVCVYVWIQKSL